MTIFTTLVESECNQYTGTSQYYRHGLGLFYTDGIEWIAKTLECFWLLDEIAIYSQKFRGKEDFLTAEFYTPIKGEGILQLTDGNENTLHKSKYDFTTLYVDKDLNKKKERYIKLFLTVGLENKYVLMLPSEY